NMLTGLAGQNDNDVCLLIPNDAWQARLDVKESDSLAGVDMARLPMSRRLAESVWLAIGQPYIDTWAPNADWIYCPRELYAPVRSAKSAITVHDLYAVEPCYQRRADIRRLKWFLSLEKGLARADVILTVSEFTKTRIIDLFGTSEKKIRVVGNGVQQG